MIDVIFIYTVESNGSLIVPCQTSHISGDCNSPKQYTECGSACPQTCFSHSDTCISVCVPGCTCPSYAPVLYSGRCITRDQCPDEAMFDAAAGAEISESGAVSSEDAEDADSLDKWGTVKCWLSWLTARVALSVLYFIIVVIFSYFKFKLLSTSLLSKSFSSYVR